MPRLTQAPAIGQQYEPEAFVFFQAMVTALSDPQRAPGICYSLQMMVVIALMAAVR